MKGNKSSYTSPEEKAYMSAVAALGCWACRKDGIYDTPAQLHHVRGGVGMSQRSSHMHVVPLCPQHHTGVGMPLSFISIHGNQKKFHEKYGSDAELSEDVRAEVELEF